MPYRTARNHLNAILTSLEEAKPTDKTNLDAVFKRDCRDLSKRGLMVLISDLLGVRKARSAVSTRCDARGHDVMVLHVLDDDELDFPFADPTRFEGLESADTLTCNPRAPARGY